MRPETTLDRLFRAADLPPARVPLPPLDPDINARYIDRWRRRLRFVPFRPAYRSWLARRYDAPAAAFGYSMSSGEVREASSPEVARLLVGADR